MPQGFIRNDALETGVLPAAEPMPGPLERSNVIAAIAKLGSVQAELGRYLVNGPNGPHFAFEEEVTAMTAEALRLLLEIEGAHFSSMLEAHDLSSKAERETLSQMLGSIERFQEVWGRG